VSRYTTEYNPKLIYALLKKNTSVDEILQNREAISRQISKKMFSNLKLCIETGRFDLNKKGTWKEIQSEPTNKIDTQDLQNDRSNNEIIVNSQELAIRTSPVSEPNTRSSIITQAQLIKLLKIKKNAIIICLKRNKKNLERHTWFETINNRKQRVFDEFAAYLIATDLRIPITKELRKFIKTDAIPKIINKEYVEKKEVEKHLTQLNNKIENLEIKIEKRFEKLEDKTIKIENTIGVLEINNKLLNLSIEYNRWARNNNYAKGTYALYWNQKEARYAKTILFKAFLNYPDYFKQNFVSLNKNGNLICAISGKELKYYQECIMHHVILDKNQKHIDFDNLFMYYTGTHIIVPISIEIHNNYQKEIQYINNFIKLRTRLFNK